MPHCTWCAWAPANKHWFPHTQCMREHWMPLMSYLEIVLFCCNGDHVHHSDCSPYLEDADTHTLTCTHKDTHTGTGIKAQKSIWEGRWMVCLQHWDLRVFTFFLSLPLSLAHTQTHSCSYISPYNSSLSICLSYKWDVEFAQPQTCWDWLTCIGSFISLLIWVFLLNRQIQAHPIYTNRHEHTYTHTHTLSRVMKVKCNHIPHTSNGRDFGIGNLNVLHV